MHSYWLITLAYYPSEKCKGVRGKDNGYYVPNSLMISKLRNLNESHVLTCDLQVSKSANYSNIVTIESFSEEFILLGGNSRPKRLELLCSDGRRRLIIVKGQDDLRQDSVMQQVFTIMNDLFRRNKHTSKMLIRTYKVIAPSKRSGIIEMVGNSEQLQDCLTRLHTTHNKDDWNLNRCKIKFHNGGNRNANNDMKLKIYSEICSHLTPVMHKFFEENYLHPSVWYESRRAYMHSIATTSMCGYILGLGDRHCQNILIDKTTAEVIHIDFGIAFEQGKTLPTPETVPFRLTRDIVDGMGAAQVTGVFKRSCEKTMEVLRTNWQTIISIVEVLLYDPLYVWTITPAEAYSRQLDSEETSPGSLGFSGNMENVNVTAERAISRLRQKLRGTEDGGSMSVEGQVEMLIQQARDPSNLSRLFVGWQPYL